MTEFRTYSRRSKDEVDLAQSILLDVAAWFQDQDPPGETEAKELAQAVAHLDTYKEEGPMCARCSHTKGLHFRPKWSPRGMVDDGCSRCGCQNYRPTGDAYAP